MIAGTFTTTIEEIRDIGRQQVRHFRLRFEPEIHFEFHPGQFINVMIPGPEKVVKRPYSIASPPGRHGYLDICWKHIPGGFATEYLWGLKPGDSLRIQGPLGRFTLRAPLPGSIIFVSTGTGIAPFRSMIHHLLDKAAGVKVLNIFGNRYEEDILYREEFEELASKHPNFRNIFTVSRPQAWTGETQYVQHVFKKTVSSPAHTHLYICGLSSMILDVENTALNIGFHKEQIFYEKYD